MDLDQLQSTMRTFELACTSIQGLWCTDASSEVVERKVHGDPAAEAIISSLSQSPRPYQPCQFILENSQVAMARFQAAGALRDAAIREWVFLEADDKRQLIR
nr:exportin-4 isoform X3 [Ipomoea batatas]